MLAKGEHIISRNTREEHTWAMRNADEERPWKGINLTFLGDLWQFRPVNLTAIFDDPFKSYSLSSTERILAMSGMLHAMHCRALVFHAVPVRARFVPCQPRAVPATCRAMPCQT